MKNAPPPPTCFRICVFDGGREEEWEREGGIAEGWCGEARGGIGRKGE